MPVVQPPKERHTSQDDGSSLKIIIPSRKDYFTLIFLGISLTFWAVFEVFAGGIAISGVVAFFGNSPEIENLGQANSSVGVLFMLIWWIGLTVGGGFALYAFLWQLIGKETIEVTQEGIKIQNAIFSLGQTKEYLASHIQELRFSSPGMNDMFAV